MFSIELCLYICQTKQQQKLKIMENVKKFGTLNAGTIVNFYRSTTADDTNFVVLDHYEDNFGKFTRVLRLDNFELDIFTQRTEITNFWTIVKEN